MFLMRQVMIVRGSRAMKVAVVFIGVGEAKRSEAKRSGRWWKLGDMLRIAFRVGIEAIDG